MFRLRDGITRFVGAAGGRGRAACGVVTAGRTAGRLPASPSRLGTIERIQEESEDGRG